MEVMRELVDSLNQYTKEYILGHPVISDKKWDDMYFTLLKMEAETGIILADSPTQSIQTVVLSKLEKVEHNHPMLSLAKTKDVNEVRSFLGNKDGILMAKLDGLTCSLTYLEGRLIKAETRGNGIVGEDITHNAMVIPSIPKRIKLKSKVVIDGEIICKLNDFEPFAADYKNPRNFAAGSIRLLNNKECLSRNLTFVAWDWIESDNITLSGSLSKLDDFGFLTVPWYYTDMDIFEEQMTQMKMRCAKDNYPIDGLVFKYDKIKEYEAMGRTDHHFKGGLAYKFYDEEYDTTLIDIEWTMGRTGVLTPVAVFEPIETDDSVVSRASLHNISIMRELWKSDIQMKGDKLKVAKMNMIIPQVMSVELNYESKTQIYIPHTCPCCGGKVEIQESEEGVKNLVCINPQCEGKLINRLDHFFGKKGIDVKGLSKATFEKLIDWGWVNNITDVLKLKHHREEWVTKTGWGWKSVDKILENIEACRYVDFDKFISALGIPLIGNVEAKKLCDNFKLGYEDLRMHIKNLESFTLINGFGTAKEEAILHYDYTEADQIIQEGLLKLNYPSDDKEEIQQSLDGLTFCITGKLKQYKNRDELSAAIAAHGGKVVGSVSSKTSYLVNNDSNSTSIKNKTAASLGVHVISEEELISMMR